MFKGIGYTGVTQCGLGFTCYIQDAYTSLCLTTGTCPAGWICTSLTTQAVNFSTIGLCGQCGGWKILKNCIIFINQNYILKGTGYIGSTTCDSGLTCYYVTQYGYSVCLPSCPSGWTCTV